LDVTGAERRDRAPISRAEYSIFGADSEIGPDLAAVDWAATPLGPSAAWPQSLRTAVRILLSSRFSMWLGWGPELTFFCNAAYRRDTLGRKYPWALGRPAREVWAEIWADVWPRIDQVLSTGQATWDEALLLFVERSGYPEESYHTFSYSPLHDDAGAVVGMLCVVREDTDRVIAERRMETLRDLGSDPSSAHTEQEALAFAADRLGRNLRDLPFTLTYLFDDGGAARLASSSGITAGHPAAPTVLAADDASVWPVAEPARGESVLVELADVAALPTGDWRSPPVQALVVSLLEPGGAPYGFLIAALNRYRPLDSGYRGFTEVVAGHISAAIGSARSYQTQQRRAEELAELDKAKTVFFSNISHEFRTPLALILGPVAELRSGSRDPAPDLDEQTRQELDVVHRNALRLNKIVNTLLDFSRIEAGRMQANFEPVDLATNTAGLASVFRSAIERAGLTFAVDCPALDEPVYLDRDMWEKVILNLLSNALKFTFDGSITVRLHRDATHAVVTITDTGVGVPATEVPQLFERFHRVPTTRARSNEGSGIGLALVKELVGLHSGSIAAQSTEGEGTTFAIRLPFGTAHLSANVGGTPAGTPTFASVADPYVEEALRWLPSDADAFDDGTFAAGPLASQAVVAPILGAQQARVLVADDNADMREYLARLLRTAGYAVDTVTDGQQALHAVRADLPALVVSDVMMQEMDGLALVAALRQDPRTAPIPVLLLSARAGQEASIEGLHAGADDYLVKPFAAAELLARVRANIELARLRNHHARWRTALVDSLQEAFFVCDEYGAVVEINAAFTQMLGYGPEDLPYPTAAPWWPQPDTDPEAHRQVIEAFATFVDASRRNFTIPLTHRDGHRLWVTTSFNHVDDPDTGHRVIVGTFRDVTAERYTVQGQTALAAVNQQLGQADTVEDAVQAAAEELHRLWQARRVLAVTFTSPTSPAKEPHVVCIGESAQWADLPDPTRNAISALSAGDLLTTGTQEPGAGGIALDHPQGVLVIWVELDERRPFAAEDQTLLTALASRLGHGLQRVQQVDQQRETALVLQHAILGPAKLPDGFAVRYQPATRPLQVGGDWYDVLSLGDGRIGLIVGDCVGHGLAAATVMGQLRSACRALLLERPYPGAALAGVDRFAERLPDAQCTTAFCAVLDPSTGELIYSSAGHTPPVVVEADGTKRTLDDGRSIPLGVRVDRPRPEARVTLPARATLLLYTDGLVERRRQPLQQGIDRAAEVVKDGGARSLEDLATDLMSGLAPPGGYQDDVALLLYRQPAPLDLTIPASVSELASTRAALRSWLGKAGVGTTQVQDILVAAGEALANSIEHGHRNGAEGTVTLRVIVLVDQVQLTIVDTGSWKVPAPDPKARRGRGITLMRGLMQHVAINGGAAGTTVHLHARIAS
jgi:PAS domain S-box-containing protein